MTVLDDRPMTGDDQIDDDHDREVPEVLEPDVDEVDAPPPGDDRDRPFDRWRSQLPTLFVVLLAVLVAAGAFILWHQNQDYKQDRDDRREAAQVASEFTTAVLSYDFHDLQGSLDRVLAVSTRDWGRQYEDAWFQDQQQIVQELRARGQVDIVDVMQGDESHGVLPVTVTFNANVRSTIGVRHLTGSYLRLDLTKVDGDWRVDDMIYLANGEQSLDPRGGGNAGETPPTTTAAP
jgi:hypothetical protein